MMENLENDVVKKTNKYVYFSNGTHMSHGDFHKHKQGIRKEYGLIHAKEYKDSVEVLIQSLKDKERLETLIENIQEKNYSLEYEIHERNNINNHDWEKSFRKESDEHHKTKDKLTSHAKILYSNLAYLPILKNYTNDKGIKFIIQQKYNVNEYRFCFDPYQLGTNFHSTLSDFYRQIDWGTINGGWMKVIGDVVTLYAQSGDYGVYDDNIATECAKIIFPDKSINSFAGKGWETI